jgi:uncharacterized membrane protein YsdA (DUF1294 family)
VAAAVGFLGLLGAAAAFGLAPAAVPVLYAAASGLSLTLYGLDKRAARLGRSRTSKATLHLVDLAGGWPGELVAGHVFRHKTSKRSFRIVFWLSVVANCAALGWLFFSDVLAVLRSTATAEWIRILWSLSS